MWPGRRYRTENRGEEISDEAFVNAIEEFKAAKISPGATDVDLCAVYAKSETDSRWGTAFLKLIPKLGDSIRCIKTAVPLPAETAMTSRGQIVNAPLRERPDKLRDVHF